MDNDISNRNAIPIAVQLSFIAGFTVGSRRQPRPCVKCNHVHGGEAYGICLVENCDCIYSEVTPKMSKADREFCDGCGVTHMAQDRRARLKDFRGDVVPENVRAKLGECMWPRTIAGERRLYRDLAAVFGPAVARRAAGVKPGMSAKDAWTEVGVEPCMMPPRDWMTVADGYREVCCPLLRGDVIAAARCVANQESGCRCANSPNALVGLLLARPPDTDPSIEFAAVADRRRVLKLAEANCLPALAAAARRLLGTDLRRTEVGWPTRKAWNHSRQLGASGNP